MNKNRRRKSHNDPEEAKIEQYNSLQSQDIVGHTYEGGQTGAPQNQRDMVLEESDYEEASGEEPEESYEEENEEMQIGFGNTDPNANGGPGGQRANQSGESIGFPDEDELKKTNKVSTPEKGSGSPFKNIFNKFTLKAESSPKTLQVKQKLNKGTKKEKANEEPIEIQASQVMNEASNAKMNPADMMGFFAPNQNVEEQEDDNQEIETFARKDKKKKRDESTGKDVVSKPPKAPKKVQFSMKGGFQKLMGSKDSEQLVQDDAADSKNDVSQSASLASNASGYLHTNERNTSTAHILEADTLIGRQNEIREQVSNHIGRQHVAKKRQEDRKKVEKELQQKLRNQLQYSDSCLEQYPSLKDLFKHRVQFSEKQRQLKKKLEERHKIPIEDTTQNTVNIDAIDYDANKKKKKQKLTIMLDPDLQEDAELTGWRKKRQDLEENLLTIKDDCTFFVHGKYIKYSNRSLGMLDNKNKFRIFLVWLINHKWFENFIILLILVNSLLLGAKDYTDYDNVTPVNRFVESCEPFFTYMFLMECVSKILGMGFILGNKCYLNDAWNWLDFTVVVTSLLEFLPSMSNMSGLRTFRLFRPLRSLTTMPSMKLLIGTLFSSLSNLGGLMGLSLFFFMIFAILGVSLWHGRIHYRCYKGDGPILNEVSGKYTWEIDESDERLCYEGQRECREGYTCGSVIDFTFNDGKNDRFMENDDLWNDVQIRSLNYAITNFDHVGSAFLTIFQCITMEGWTHIMNIYEDTFYAAIVNLYFISCVVICSFFLLNLTIAVMLMKYEELDKKQTNSKHKEELRQLGISFKLPLSLIEFLIKQDSIQESPKAMKMIKQEESFLKQLFAPKRAMVDMSLPYYQNLLVQICQKIAINPFFEALIIFVIIINTACLAMDKFPELDEAIIQVLAQANFVFTGIFTLEVILKMIGLGVREFLKEQFNKFDLVIVLVSIVEMQGFNGDDDGSGVFSAFRAFRLFKIFKLFKVGDLRILIDSIAFTMTTISDYVILLLLFIYVFALLGMSFFAGKLKFDDHDQYVPPYEGPIQLGGMEQHGVSPRNNFDQVQWSLVLIFQILLSENWNYIMYDCIRTTGSLYAIYFIALVLGGNIIMLNLFLAILLGNFEKARNFGLKKKIFEAFREIMNGKKTLNQTLDIMLSDLSIHVKLKILKWDEVMVQKIHSNGETEIAQDLMEIGGRFIKDESDDEEPKVQKLQKDKKKNVKSIEEYAEIDESKKKILELVLEDENSESEEEVEEEEQLNDSQNFGKESQKNSATEANDKEVADNMQENSAEANQNMKDDEKIEEDKSKLKLKFQFSKTIFKYHRMNPKLIRSRELSRQFNYDQSDGLKEILQKEMNIQQNMDGFTEEEMKTHIINMNKKFKDPLYGIKKATKVQISTQRISTNIERFRQQNIFAALDKEQAKISIQQTLTKDLFNKGRKQVRPQQNLLFSKGDESPPKNQKKQPDLSFATPTKEQEKSGLNTENKEQKLSSMNSSSMEKSNQKGETNSLSDQKQSPLKTSKSQTKGNQSLKKLTKKGEQLRDGSKQGTKDQQQLDSANKATGLQAEEANFQTEKQQKQMTIVQDKEKEDFEKYVEENEILKRAIVVEEKPKQPTAWDKFVKRSADSSLLILHKNNWLRRKCMLLAESPETLDDLYAMDKKEKEEEERLNQELLSEEQSLPSEKGTNSQQVDTEMSSPLKKDKARKGDQQLVGLLHQKKPQSYVGLHPSKIFENIVLLLITVSSLTLVLDNPLYDPDSGAMILLAQIDSFFTLLFAIEASIKILAKGLLFNRMDPIEPYLMNPWNMLDAFVVMASLVDFTFQMSGVDMAQLSALKALRAFRALRPLRMIARNEGMRLVVNALLASLPSMGNVLLVCSLFILIFAIMGVKFFKGKFNYCADLDNIFHDNSSSTHYMSLIIDKYDCENYGGNWIPRDSNFDNTVNAMSTLFQMTTTEGWVEVMFDGIDSTGIGLQPIKYANAYLIFYFIAFMIIGSQFIINLFVGVVIDNFNTIKEREEMGNMFVTEQQKSWIEIQKIGHMKNLRTKIDEPTDPTRQDFYKLVKDKRFEYTITFFICINTLVMATKHHNMGPLLEDLSEYGNFVFAFVFNAEMVLKLIGMGRTYLWDAWNKFDCFIVIATDIGLVLNRFDIGGGLSTATTVIRGVRIMRIFRLIKSSVHIRLILDTIMNILPQIQNVMTLILLLLFIGAALAINLFSQVQHQRYLDDKNNFQSFPGSMIMLWKFSTGEGWNKYMYELANTKGYAGKECQDHQSYEDIQKHGVNACGTVVSYPFFIAFTILVTMLILNLSIAAVIEGLDRAKKENMGIVAGDEIEHLIELWQEFDPFASGWISMQQLIFLLYLLPPPLGRRSSRISMEEDPNYDPDKQVQGLKQQDRYLVHVEKNIIMKKIDALELLRDLNIKVYKDPKNSEHQKRQIHYVSVFKALIKRVYKDKQLEIKLALQLNRKLKGMWNKKYTEIASKETLMNKGVLTVRQVHAGRIILKWLKNCVNNQKNIRAVQKDLKNNNGKRKQEKVISAKKRKEPEVAKGKNKIGDKSQVKNKRQENLEQMAVILEDIVYQKYQTRGPETNEEIPEYVVKNMYIWKCSGGEKLHDDVLRQIADNDFNASDQEALDLEQKDQIEAQYKKYKEQRTKSRRRQKKRLAQQQNQQLNDSKNFENTQEHLFGRRFTYIEKQSLEFSDASGEYSDNGEVLGDSLSDIDVQEATDKINSIQINIGSLEDGTNVESSKACFRLNPDGAGLRPKRDFLAERYEKDIQEKKLQKKLEEGFTTEASELEFQPNIKDGKPVITYEYQENKIRALQKLQNKFKSEKLGKKGFLALKQRPQINRNREDFEYGNSGQTIELDDQNPIIDCNNEGFSTDLMVKQEFQEDIVSQPFLDKFYLPSRAIRKSKDQQVEVVKIKQKRRIGFVYEGMDDKDQKDGKVSQKTPEINLRSQSTNVRRNNQALSNIKDRDTLFGKLAAKPDLTMNNNFFHQDDMITASNATEIISEEPSSVSTKKMILTAKNFPTDINIVDKHLHANLKQNLNANMHRQNTKQVTFQPKPLKERFAIVGALAGHGGPKYNMQMEEQKLGQDINTQSSIQNSSSQKDQNGMMQGLNQFGKNSMLLDQQLSINHNNQDGYDDNGDNSLCTDESMNYAELDQN